MGSEHLIGYEQEGGEGKSSALDHNPAHRTKRKTQMEADEIGGETRKKKSRGERKVAPPTADEMLHLRETETLFKSSLLRLEIEEMLRETEPLKSLEKAASDWIEHFADFLSNVEESDQWNHVGETDWLNEVGVSFPLFDLGLQFDGAYRFIRPLRVETIGSYNCGCSMGPKFTVDLAVVLPKEFYRKKDYLNQTYHYKRALYLCAIAGELLKSDLLSDASALKFVSVDGDSLKPALSIDPGGKAAGKLAFLCHILPHQDTFPLSRFLPSSNNIRDWWWNSGQPSKDGGKLRPSPLYNNSIAKDLVAESNERLRKETLQKYPKMSEAVRLLRVWLTQRSLYQVCRGFTPYLVSMTLIYLMDRQKINKHMSSYQLIRILWLYLSESDWCEEGASLYRGDTSTIDNLASPPPLSLFHNNYDVVFVDPSGYVNLAARLDKSIYSKVRSDSAMALDMLDKNDRQAFHSLFLVQMPFLHQYDHFICFRNEETVKKVVAHNLPRESDIDFNGDPKARFLALIRESLGRGLGDRLVELGLRLDPPLSWPVASPPPDGYMCDDSIALGLRLHPRNALRYVDRGPQPNLPEGAEFRKLWGEKCEVRRFKDGSVCECVVWSDSAEGNDDDIRLGRRLAVNESICRFLLSRLGLAQGDYAYVSNQLELILETRFGLSAEEAGVKVHRSLAEFSRQLVELEDLPLEINSVHCISPVYRYAEVFPPGPTVRSAGNTFQRQHLHSSEDQACLLPETLSSAPSYVRPIDLVLEMTLTRKWPNDVGACRRLTAAFYVAIAKMLLNKHKLKFILQPDCLLIQKDGLMWRLWLHCSKEISLLKLSKTEDGVESYKDTISSLQLERKLNHLPNLSGALHGLSVEEPGFGGAARLVKRWLSSQLIDSSEMPTIVCELLVAGIILSPRPYHPLVQPQQLFLRFLHTMATTDWTSRLLVVNFNNLLSKDELREAERMFERDRKSLPTLVVVTPYDHSGCLWTKSAPTLSTLVRVAKLASAALDILRLQLHTASLSSNFNSVFEVNLELYDVVVELKSSMIPRKSEQLKQRSSKEKNSSKLSGLSLPVTDFDPPLIYLNYLRDNYKEFALFVYDECGGRHIGVLLRPSVLQPKPLLKASTADATYPDYAAVPPCLRINLKSLISDLKEVGRGLVQSVTLNPRHQKTLRY